MSGWKRYIIIIGIVLAAQPGQVSAAADPTSASTSFKMVESEIGASGNITSSSTGYKLAPGVDDGGATLGEFAAGNSASTSFQSNSGFNTTAQPSLTLVVNTLTVDLGNLSTSTASTSTATFNVKNYTSYGYVVQMIGASPTHSGHPLTALSTDTASAAGVEQFGINLRANTSPVTVGADPVQVPSSSFSYGVAGDGTTGTYGTTRPYTQPNKYRYASGGVIASAPKSSGETDYTVSFLANISSLTPGGKYTGNLTIVVTGTF